MASGFRRGRGGASIFNLGCLKEFPPTFVDDTTVGCGTVGKQVNTLPQGFPEMGCCYTIVWQKRDGIIIPIVMRGSHEFLNESRDYAFTPNQGCVGRLSEALDSMDHEVISNMFCIDPRVFLRKQAALLTGIASVLFLPHSTGVLMEFGFTNPQGANLSLPLLRTSHAVAMDQCVLAEKRSGLVFVSTNRRSTSTLRTRSPSPAEHTQDDLLWPSIGSRGHPLCCKLPCKYVLKRKGCKDGLNCIRCHLCRFSEGGAKHSFKLEREFKLNAPAYALFKLGVPVPDHLREQGEGCSDK